MSYKTCFCNWLILENLLQSVERDFFINVLELAKIKYYYRVYILLLY